MESIKKSGWGLMPDSGRSLLVYLPGGIILDLKNPGQASTLDETDSLYYPLFPTRKDREKKKETYHRVHEKLMTEMRIQLRLKNRVQIEKTGRKLHRLRKRFRSLFAA